MKYLKSILLAIIIMVFCFSPSFAADKYCYTEQGLVIEGPRKLPNGWRNISGLNSGSDAELKALGWLPYVLGTPPEYDKATQYLTSVNVVGEDSVVRVYTINQHTQAQIDNLAEMAAIAAARVQKIANAKELMALSDLSNITYAQIATHIENTFPNLSPAQRASLTKLYQLVLAGHKRNDWSK